MLRCLTEVIFAVVVAVAVAAPGGHGLKLFIFTTKLFLPIGYDAVVSKIERSRT